jgi:flagella basal body P-ring formation protein FlgA
MLELSHIRHRPRSRAPRFVGPSAARAIAVAATLLVGTAAPSAEPGRLARPDGSSGRAPIRIELRARVEVERGLVLLGDVAHLSGSDGAGLRDLQALPLGRAPGAGRPLRLERDDLMRWIRARTGIDPARVEWSGAEASELRLAVHRLAWDVIAERAVASVREALSGRGLRAEIHSSGEARDIDVPAGPVELNARPVPQEAALARRLTVWVDVVVAGRFVRTVPVALQLSVFGPAYVAKEGSPPGSRVVPSNLEEREVEWSGRASPPVGDTSVASLRLRRPLAAGEPLTRAQVETAPLVSRGEWATLHATQGLVHVESRVEVLQDGFSGQTVRVRLPRASGVFAARVTGTGTVEVLR